MSADPMPFALNGPVIVLHVPTGPAGVEGGDVAACAPIRVPEPLPPGAYPQIPRVMCTGCLAVLRRWGSS